MNTLELKHIKSYLGTGLKYKDCYGVIAVLNRLDADDAKIISKYAVDLGCQRNVINDHIVPAPVQTSNTKKGTAAFQHTFDFFNNITAGAGNNLLPETTSKK